MFQNEYTDRQTQYRYRAQICHSCTSARIKKELTESSYSIFFNLQSEVLNDDTNAFITALKTVFITPLNKYILN